MSATSEIEWTDATWNPVRGCTKVSPGCAHCYAEVFAERFRGVPGHPYEQGFDPRLVPEKLLEPIRWRKSRMIFVNSMRDLFHEDVPDVYIEAAAIVMQRASWHTFQVLTKRSERLRALLRTKLRQAAKAQHIWWGVSVENRRVGVPRIRDLQQSGALIQFLSIEPLLEELGPLDLDGVPFFFKQWGGVRKSENGRKLFGRTYDEFPSTVRSAQPDRLRQAAVLKNILGESILTRVLASHPIPSGAAYNLAAHSAREAPEL